MKNLYDKIYNYLTFIFFFLIIFLSIKCFNKSIILEFNKIKIANIYSNFFDFKNIINNTNDKTVDNEIIYIKNQNKYITNSNVLVSIDNGVVRIAKNDKIIILQNNSYNVVFEGDFNVQIKDNDYIEKGSIIGSYFEPFLLYFIDNNGEIYTYEEYLAIAF